MLPSLTELSIHPTGAETDPVFKKLLAERQKASKKAAKRTQPRAENNQVVSKKPSRGRGGGGAVPPNDRQRDEPRVVVAHDDLWVDDDMEDDAPDAERKSVEEVVREYIEQSRRERAPRQATVPSRPPSPILDSEMDSPQRNPPPRPEGKSKLWQEFERLRDLQKEGQSEKRRVLEQKAAERERSGEEARKEHDRLEAERKATMERHKAAARALREAEYADQGGGVRGPDADDIQQEFDDL